MVPGSDGNHVPGDGVGEIGSGRGAPVDHGLVVEAHHLLVARGWKPESKSQRYPSHGGDGVGEIGCGRGAPVDHGLGASPFDCERAETRKKELAANKPR